MEKSKALECKGTIKKVPLGKMQTHSLHAQRETIAARLDYLLANFDLDMFGVPVLSEQSNGLFYILDGKHRTTALKNWIGKGWENEVVDCLVYKGLTEPEEAEIFLRLNDNLAVSAFDKFHIAVNAKRPDEVHINNIVLGAGLRVARDSSAGAIGAVTALRRVYERGGASVLAKTLRIIRDAYGDIGFESLIIEGIGYLCQRYDGALPEAAVVACLSSAKGSIVGLRGKAEVLHKQTANAKTQCIAAAAVEIINSQRKGNKIPSWWKS